MEVINLLFEEFRVFQKLEVYEWFCIRGGIIDPYTTLYLLFCVMVSCFAGYIMTRSARRKAGRLAWSAIWGGCGWITGADRCRRADRWLACGWLVCWSRKSSCCCYGLRLSKPAVFERLCCVIARAPLLWVCARACCRESVRAPVLCVCVLSVVCRMCSVWYL